jgi:hypothetical protein
VVDVGSIGDPDEECDPPDDPSHLKDWLMVRTSRRRLIEATRGGSCGSSGSCRCFPVRYSLFPRDTETQCAIR